MSTSTNMEMEEDPATQYGKLLLDLKMNSKPVINVLTMMAEDFMRHAPVVVQTIERHLNTVHPNVKLPVLYLIDSIVKNVGQDYPNLFTQNIVSTFCGVFEKVDDKVKQQMFKLRQTWNDVFPQRKLYAIDVRCHQFDRNWPISAPPPTNASSSIHVNPKFLNTAQPGKPAVATKLKAVAKVMPNDLVIATATVTGGVSPNPQDISVAEAQMRAKLLQKQKELLELQQKKIELELMQTKNALDSKRFEEMESALQQEKMLLGQAEMAKSKTNIAHKILISSFPSSQSQSSQPSKPSSAVTVPVVVKMPKSPAPEPQQQLQVREGSSPKDSSSSKEKSNRSSRDGSSPRDKEKLTRSPSKHSKKAARIKEEDSSSKGKGRSSRDGSASGGSPRDKEKLTRSPSKHSKKTSSSSIKEDKDSSSERKERGSRSSSRDGSGTGSSPREKERLTRSPSKHSRKNAAIKEEESFQTRRFAVLKRNYRKSGTGSGIDGDEEDKIPVKIPREEEIQNQGALLPSPDVDLRFHGQSSFKHEKVEAEDVEMICKNPARPQKQPTPPPLMKKVLPRPSGNGSNMIVDLFGREDVDLRQPPTTRPGGSWGSGGNPPPQNWGPGQGHPRMGGPQGHGSWIAPGPNRPGAGPRGPNPFEEALIDPNEQLRSAERDGSGSWVPNPRAMHMMEQQRWGPGAPPPFIAVPRGPNPFEEALGDQYNLHPNEMEMMRAGPGDRGAFKGLRGRRGGRGRRPGRGGMGFMPERPNMHPNMPLHGNFLPPPFMDAEHQRGGGHMLRRQPGPGELFMGNPNQYEFNDFNNENDNAASEMEEAAPTTGGELPDVTSLLEMATRLGFLTSNEAQSANQETEAVEDAPTPVVTPVVPVLAIENKPKESAISKYQKYQKFQRNNRHRRPAAAPVVEVISPPLPTVDVLLVSEEKNYFKERRQTLINQMWIGVQCSMCGLRFPPDQKTRYSEHLQWHFRRNRKEKENAKKAQSRAWYYKKSDWLKFEEVEDLDERATSLFEIQEDADQSEASPGPGIVPEDCTVVASGHEGALCPQCGEKFNSKYDEDKEEWRLLDAVLEETEDGEENVYHFICHQDYLKSIQEESMQVELLESMEVDKDNITEQVESSVAGAVTDASSPPPPAPMEDEDDDEVLILKEGKKEVVVMEIDVVDDEDGVKSEETNENEVNNKEIENGPDSPKESSGCTSATPAPTENNSDSINSSDKQQQPVFNYSIYSRSPIVVNDDDDSSSNLLPGIALEGSVSGGVFGFALNSGIRRERSESPTEIDEKKIVYKSMEFDFPKIKIEPPDTYEEAVNNNVPEDAEDFFASDENNVARPATEVVEVEDNEPIDLTGEDDSMDAVDGSRPIHQTTSIDGNLHQEVHLTVPLAPPPKIRINMDITATSPKSKSTDGTVAAAASPKPNSSPHPQSPPSPARDNLKSPTHNSDSESSASINTEIVFTDEMKCLKPSLAKFIDSGRKFKNCPPKEGKKEESGLCVIS